MSDKINGFIKKYDGYSGIIKVNNTKITFTYRDIKKDNIIKENDYVSFICEQIILTDEIRYVARFIEKVDIK